MHELRLIESHYGDRKAERSGVPLINHIHEGLAILDYIRASLDTKRAFCLHPMFQDDPDLASRVGDYEFMSDTIFRSTPRTMLLVMEYRNQANAWLSDKVEDWSTYSYSGETPRLVVEDFRCNGKPSPGPLLEVKHMLIADKVQNWKDFRQYHAQTHERAKELEVYFQAWFKALDLSPITVKLLCDVIAHSKVVAP